MPEMTDRQRVIKDLLDEGLQAREIGEQLGISRNAVYQQIQRMRNHGFLDAGYTPTGQAPREIRPGADALARLLTRPSENGTSVDTDAASLLAVVQLLRETRDELDRITQRLSAIIPR